MQSFDFFVAAERHFTQMVENLQSSVTKESHLNILEHDLLEESRKLARLRLQGHIDLRGLGDVGDVVISAEHVKLNHRRKMSRSLYTVFGKISINRVGYCRPRHHNRFPLDRCVTEFATWFILIRVATNASQRSYKRII